MHDVFYFTDVHGYYPLFRAAMDFCMKQDPECMIIYGGDACDRGDDGYRIMKELLDNPQVVYLKGNHEDIFVHAAWFIKRDYHGLLNDDEIWHYLYNCEISDFSSQEVQLAIYNGGYKTLYNWMKDGMPEDFVNRINKLPVTFSYENLDFCHAGGRPKEFKAVQIAEYEEEFIDKDDFMMLVWDRHHIAEGWTPNRICVFGHTPTSYLPAIYYGKDKSLSNIHPCMFTGEFPQNMTGKKLDMDTGAVASGRLYVLNCLTMTAYGFNDTDFNNTEIRNHDVKQFEVIRY